MKVEMLFIGTIRKTKNMDNQTHNFQEWHVIGEDGVRSQVNFLNNWDKNKYERIILHHQMLFMHEIYGLGSKDYKVLERDCPYDFKVKLEDGTILGLEIVTDSQEMGNRNVSNKNFIDEFMRRNGFKVAGYCAPIARRKDIIHALEKASDLTPLSTREYEDFTNNLAKLVGREELAVFRKIEDSDKPIILFWDPPSNPIDTINGLIGLGLECLK